MDSTKVPRQMEKYDVLMNSHIWSLIHAFPQLACRKDYIFFFFWLTLVFKVCLCIYQGQGGIKRLTAHFKT